MGLWERSRGPPSSLSLACPALPLGLTAQLRGAQDTVLGEEEARGTLLGRGPQAGGTRRGTGRHPALMLWPPPADRKSGV